MHEKLIPDVNERESLKFSQLSNNRSERGGPEFQVEVKAGKRQSEEEEKELCIELKFRHPAKELEV